MQWGETDAAGIVYYPNYYRWFDWATHEWLRSAGYLIDEMLGASRAVPLIETHARFLAALKYDQEIEILSRITEVRARTFRIDHRITRLALTVTEGHEVRMWVKLGADGMLHPEPFPDDLRQILLSARS